MNIPRLTLITFFFFTCSRIYSQAVRFENYEMEAVGVSVSKTKIMGKDALRATKDSTITTFDEPTFVKIKGIDFKNGIIEVKVLSRLLPNAPESARGFIGIAFHINETNTKFESFYVRPVNARVNDQVRRNHTLQYYSYPDYKFDRLRQIAPGQYESYADMEMNKWITLRIEIKDTLAKLFVNASEQPSLIINDLKLGSNVSGAIALWVEIGTEGYFTDLKISKQD